MFRNYLLTAFRNLWRNKAFSGIHVLGLSIGISAALVIYLIVAHEFSFDTSIPDSQRVYRVVMDMRFGGIDGHSSAVPAPLSTAIQQEISGVEQTVPLMQFQGNGSAKVKIKREGWKDPVVFKKQPHIVFTNPDYFYLLPHQWLVGSPKISLQNPFSVVLTESRAQQYFPSLPPSDVVGQSITYNDDFTVTVSGIVKDRSENSSFESVEFISFATIAKTHLQDNFMMNVWNDWMAYSQAYVKLSAASRKDQVEAQLQKLMKKYNPSDQKAADYPIKLRLQPMQDVHFNQSYIGFNQRIAHRPTLYGLSAIAAFLLLLACINFINLTTANATQRAKEIGVRKTMGSSRNQLVIQFLGETFFITLIATTLSICLTPVLLHLFADFTPPGLRFNLIDQPSLLVFLLLITVVVSFVAGLYPALVLSGYKPALVLKNQLTGSNETRRAWVRKSLTVSQFVVAQFFVIATLLVSKQIHYALTTDLGFDKEAIISFSTPRDTSETRKEHLLTTLSSMPEVALASRGFLPPAVEGAAFTNISYGPKPDLQASIQIRWGDPQFLDIYNLKILAGRNVLTSDSVTEILINENYARLLGFARPADAIGQPLTLDKKQIPIVGVMRDFHESSMHTPIMPLVFTNQKGGFYHIKLKPNAPGQRTWQQGIARIQTLFQQTYPDADFEYAFFDESIAKLYEKEIKTAQLLSWATGLSILISCLGLLGLVMYTIHTRRKEIGIRKILGASVSNIVLILSKDFVKLVLVSFVLAAPLAWWAADQWLQDYAYKTTLSGWVFVLSGFAMLVLALLTLSIHTLKAATENPVKNLRNE